MRDRKREIGFALAVLLAVPVGMIVAETAARQIEQKQEAGQMNWSKLRRAAAVDRPGPMTFRPGSRYERLRFNNEGLRGPDLMVPATPGTIRILFAGDSKVFAAEVSEDQTIPANAAGILRTRFPQCRFDYANVSGPGYTLPEITQLLNAHLPRLQPSIIVLLAGSPMDLIAASPQVNAKSDETGSDSFGSHHDRLARLLESSEAYELLQRELLLLSPGTMPGPAARQTLAELSQRQRLMLGDLSASIGPRPTIAIAYRGRDESTETLAANWLAARRLRQNFPGMDSQKAVAVRQLIVDELRHRARQSQWSFIDPIADIASKQSAFLDRIHFSPEGHAYIAREVAHVIGQQVGKDCKLVEHSQSGKM